MPPTAVDALSLGHTGGYLCTVGYGLPLDHSNICRSSALYPPWLALYFLVRRNDVTRGLDKVMRVVTKHVGAELVMSSRLTSKYRASHRGHTGRPLCTRVSASVNVSGTFYLIINDSVFIQLNPSQFLSYSRDTYL